MDKNRWRHFQVQFMLTPESIKTKMIADNLSWFELKPDWVESKVWYEVVKAT